MAKIPAALAAHLGKEVTTLCHCWRLTRGDGQVMGFTDHDRQIACDGTVFMPETGLSATEARRSLGLAVDTVDVEGALSSLDIGEGDVVAGLYDGATVETLLVNWQRPEEFARLRRAVIGQIARRDGRFVAELESPERALDQTNGRTVRRLCDAELGDGRCRVNLEDGRWKGAGTLVSTQGNSIAVSGLEAFESGWFANGILTWTSGASAGRRERVSAHRKDIEGTVLDLWRDTAAAVAPGDAFTVTAGCDKQFSTCRAKFANSANFRGFPHLPGNDVGYSYVVEGQVFDGGPVVE
ncbi:DUF2163 domain-containing protein [Chelativorans sp. AA-79]|uniref:DUF2163 domain-containing protein n=1 Tax=Chelativorans sp. AA-79 TaxID=3028735 RepID=UPI0023F7F826|nr:DUF2163 domain-containing protein [Chelativorans sp. AA-79]WEX07728.1 DUF2163 domain-containing protein [Chelativorans sp. AA-79]